MRLIRWSVEHSAAVFALYGVAILLSALSLWRLIPLRLTPSVKSPQLAVITASMGMPALVVEQRLTNPIERALAGVADLASLRSMSMDGMSVVILEFPYGHDLREGAANATAAVAALGSDLGGQSTESSGHAAVVPRVVPYDPLRIPVLRLAVRAPDWEPAGLANFVDTVLASRIRQVPGVESVWSFGAARPQVDVVVDREAAASTGLTLAQITEAIDTSNSPQGAGALQNVLTRTVPIQLDAQAGRPSELESVVVTTAESRPINLREVAKIGSSLPADRAVYRYNSREAVEVNVVESPQASSPRTVAGVRVALAQLVRNHPGLVVEEAYDNAHFVGLVATNVWWELGLAVVLTGLVVYLFLGDWRGTLVVLAAVPTTLACVVLLFVPLGLSFNSSTLVGLLLAIGRLVDDTIIDLCSVARHRAMGRDARTAAIEGCSEVRRAVISATVVICLVMLPLTFAGGLTQDMFEGIVWPFLLALAASLLVAMTLTPCLIAWLYAGVPVAPPRAGERFLQRLASKYRVALGRALRHRGTVLCAALAALYLAFLMFPLIGMEMMPHSDTGQIYAVLEARPGTPTGETARMTEKLEAILRRQPEVLKVSTEIGMGGPAALYTGYGTTGTNTASLLITLRDKDDRGRTLWQVVDAVHTEATLTIPNLRGLSLKEMGSDVMATSMAPVQLIIRGPDLARLAYLAEQTRDLALRVGGLSQVATTWSLETGAWALRPDARALATLGLTPEALAQQTSAALQGVMARSTLADGTPIMVSYPANQQRTLADLQDMPIAGKGGTRPLAELAQIEPGVWPSMIEHDGLQRCNSVVASYRQGGPGSMQLSMDWSMASRMQVGFPPGYSLEQRGDMVAMMDSANRLLRGMGLALVLMYLALAVQFRSSKVPLVIMAAIPLSLPGVFLALLLAEQTVSTVSLLGFAALIGMDVTGSILLLDAVLLQRAQGKTLWRALLAGAPSRLRPVLMTVSVTLAVMVPLAFFPATGMDAYAPLATVVMGGLAMSSALTLFVVPVLYSFLNRRT